MVDLLCNDLDQTREVRLELHHIGFVFSCKHVYELMCTRWSGIGRQKYQQEACLTRPRFTTASLMLFGQRFTS